MYMMVQMPRNSLMLVHLMQTQTTWHFERALGSGQVTPISKRGRWRCDAFVPANVRMPES